jgi:hypothetical protein
MCRHQDGESVLYRGRARAGAAGEGRAECAAALDSRFDAVD